MFNLFKANQPTLKLVKVNAQILAFAFLTVSLSAGCVKRAQKPSTQTRLAVSTDSQTSIIGGQLLDRPNGLSSLNGAQQKALKSVVGLFDTKDQFLCTGTLIGSHTVMTAAHCIEGAGTNLVVVFADDVYQQIDLDASPATNVKLRQVIKAEPHPDYAKVNQDIQDFNWSDLAVLHFAGEIPEGFEVSPLDDKQPQEKDQVLLAGYGVSEVELKIIPNPKKIPDLQQRIEEGSIICTGSKKLPVCREVILSGDGPLRFTNSLISYVESSEFVNEEPLHSTCMGDSGGPAYRLVQGEYVLAGITSRGSGVCDGDSVYTMVHSYLQWIKARLK